MTRTHWVAFGALLTGFGLSLTVREALSQSCDTNCPRARRDARGCCPAPTPPRPSSAGHTDATPATAAAASGANFAVAQSDTTWSTADTNNWSLVPALAVAITTRGGPVLLTANVNFNAVDVGSGRGWGCYTIFRGDTNLGNATYGLQIAEGTLESENDPATMTFVDAPPAGVHTYTVRVRAGNATTQLSEAGVRSQLAAIELH